MKVQFCFILQSCILLFCYHPFILHRSVQEISILVIPIQLIAYMISTNLYLTFVDFQNFHFVTKLQITLVIGQKFVGQKFEKETSDITNFCAFLSRSSWYQTFFPKTLLRGCKLASKTERFSQFNKITTCFGNCWQSMIICN